MKELKQKTEKKFVEFFEKAFGEEFEIKCDWGFPTMAIELQTKNEEMKTIWRFVMDVTKPDYTLQTKSYKIEDDKEIPEWAVIDKGVLEFIVGNIMAISSQIFPDNEPETEEPTEEK